MSTTFKLVDSIGRDLSSRRTGAILRGELSHLLDQEPELTAVLDFSGVRTVSASFADELIAVLVAERGESWFKTRVRFANVDPDVRQSILEAVDERLTRSDLQLHCG